MVIASVLRLLALAALLTIAPLLPAQADVMKGWRASGQVTVASDSTSKGISETEGNGQLDGRIGLSRGIFISGVRLKNVGASDGRDIQSALSLGAKFALLGTDVKTQVIHKINHGSGPGVDHDFYEVETQISRSFANTTVQFDAVYSPDSSGATAQAGYYELSLSRPLNARIDISGGVGFRDLEPQTNYTAFNAGVSYAVTDRVDLDLRLYSTDRPDYSKAHKDRVVLSLRKTF